MKKMRRYYSYPRVAEPLEFEMSPIARKFAFAAIFLSMFLIFGNLAANAYYDPKSVAERELENIARDYYENYYYDAFVNGIKTGWKNNEEIVYASESDKWPLNETTESQIASYEDYQNEVFYEYVSSGFPRVYLRNLLLFDNGRHSGSRYKFSGRYICNTNHTSVRIMPHSPFGKKDYDLIFEYECEWDAE